MFSWCAKISTFRVLLTNLHYAFDVIGVSETWTVENNKTMNNHTTPGYQKFFGTKGSPFKSGCGLFFKKDLNFKEIIDLNVKFINDQNEFSSAG